MPSSLQRVQSQNRELNQVQDHLQRSLSPLLGNSALYGELINSVKLVSGANRVDHKLGRKLQGWTIVRQRAQAQVWDSQDSNLTPELNLTLSASAPVTVDLYVF